MDKLTSIAIHICKGIIFYTLLFWLILYGAPALSTEVNHYTSDDGSTQFTLPFTFNLYGEAFDTAKMYTNGVVQFGDQGYGHFCCNGEELGDTTAWYQTWWDISYSIMPLWTDIYANNSTSRQYTENNATSFTFGWENIREYNRLSDNTFALTIDDTGSWYTEYDSIDILNHAVTVGSVGDYSAGEYDQIYYGTQPVLGVDILNSGAATDDELSATEQVIAQYTNDGICDWTALEDPDCANISTSSTTYDTDDNLYTGQDDGQIIDDGQDDGYSGDDSTIANTDPYYSDLPTVTLSAEDYGTSSDEYYSPDGQDTGDTLGDTGETNNESPEEQNQEVYEEPSTQNESNVVYMANEQILESNQESPIVMVTEEVMEPGSLILSIDPNAALNTDSAFSTKQRTSSFRRSVNSRAVAHLNLVGGLPTIGATSAEQYQAMTSSGSTVNGMLVNQEMANDPSRMYAPANPSNPTGTGMMIADASQSMNNNTFDPNQTGMYGIPDNVDNETLSGMIVASESPMGNEIELKEALGTEDLGGLNINDFNQPKLLDQNNWYSDQNTLQQGSIYNNQSLYGDQEFYKTGANWYGNN